MRNFKKKCLLALASIAVPVASFAGKSGLKISSIGEIENKASEGADAIKNIATYVLGAVLAIGLIFVIYALATSNPKAKEYLIGWIIAVIVILVAGMII